MRKLKLTVVTNNREFKERMTLLFDEYNDLKFIENPLENSKELLDSDFIVINLNCLEDNIKVHETLGMYIATNTSENELQTLYLVAIDELGKCRISIDEELINKWGSRVQSLEELEECINDMRDYLRDIGELIL